MPKLLSLFLPNRPFNIFGETKPVPERNRWRDPDVRGSLPSTQIDFAGRTPLTRPSSPRPALEGNVGSKCYLDAFPLEIRQQIWGEVVGGGRTFHLVMVERQLKAPECLSPDPVTCNGDCRRLWGPNSEAVKSCQKFLLPLLLTSRQIYSEAIDLIYSSNIFETHDPDTLEFLPLLLLPQRINAVHSLVFTWRFRRYPPYVHPAESYKEDQDLREASWTSIWHNIASMQKLQDLHVKLDVRDAWWGSFDPKVSEVLLESIRKVTTPETFILTLPFPPDVTSRLRINAWSADKNWKGGDPWEQLPCTIQRVGSDFFYES